MEPRFKTGQKVKHLLTNALMLQALCGERVDKPKQWRGVDTDKDFRYLNRLRFCGPCIVERDKEPKNARLAEG